MSYDVEIHERGKYQTSTIVWERNMTINISSMLEACDLRLLDLDGMVIGEAMDVVSKVLVVFVVDKKRVKVFAPSNGWGTYDQCFAFLIELFRALASEAKANDDSVLLVYS